MEHGTSVCVCFEYLFYYYVTGLIWLTRLTRLLKRFEYKAIIANCKLKLKWLCEQIYILSRCVISRNEPKGGSVSQKKVFENGRNWIILLNQNANEMRSNQMLFEIIIATSTEHKIIICTVVSSLIANGSFLCLHRPRCQNEISIASQQLRQLLSNLRITVLMQSRRAIHWTTNQNQNIVFCYCQLPLLSVECCIVFKSQCQTLKD